MGNESNFSIHINKSKFTHVAQIGTVTDGVINVGDSANDNNANLPRIEALSSQDAALLAELPEIQEKLRKIADTLGDLRDAIEKGNNPTVQEKIKELSMGGVADILKEIASKALLNLLGIP